MTGHSFLLAAAAFSALSPLALAALSSFEWASCIDTHFMILRIGDSVAHFGFEFTPQNRITNSVQLSS